jgi:hypothetical protein
VRLRRAPTSFCAASRRSRITIRSRGELDAHGTNPEGWQLDRRVEIHETTPAAR